MSEIEGLEEHENDLVGEEIEAVETEEFVETVNEFFTEGQIEQLITEIQITNQYLTDIFNFLHDYLILFGVLGLSAFFAYALFKEVIKW